MEPRKRRAAKWLKLAADDRGRYSIGVKPVACGKVCYSSRSEAKRSIRRTIGSGLMADKERMTHYWCVKCESFHIGHNRPPEERGVDAGVS